MMSPDSNCNDLSPRMSIKDIGDSLSSLSFDRDNITGPSSPLNNNNNALPSNPNNNNNNNNNNTMVIREEDLIVLSNTLEQALDSADQTLRGLENDRELLPSAILRKCHEFADGLGSLAGELENQSSEERRLLVEAIRDDLKLFEETHSEQLNMNNGNQPPTKSIQQQQQQQQQSESPPPIPDVKEDEEIKQALSGASTLLRDVEAAFREIGNDEAEEIADAALIMARLFLLSLQNLQWNLAKQLPTDSSKTNASTVWIEELDEDNDDDKDNNASEKEETNNNDKPKKRNPRRMRVLWPPLGPKVDGVMEWTKEEASKRPVLTVALGLTLWPVAISTALLGTSLCLLDGALQDTYEKFHDSPWISILEESAAQAYQTGRLALATGKLVGRQSLRVASRQIERRGGIQPIAQELGGMALDKITHPIDTVSQILGGVTWGLGVARDATEDFLTMRRESQETLI